MTLIHRVFKENKRTDRKKNSMPIIAQYDARKSVFLWMKKNSHAFK